VDAGAHDRIQDASLAQFNGLIVMSGLLVLVALVGFLLFLRIACFHCGCLKRGVFSEKLRGRLRSAATAAMLVGGSSVPRPSVATDEKGLLKRWWARVKNSVGETESFTYPTIVLLAATVTPVILVYSCFYIYSVYVASSAFSLHLPLYLCLSHSCIRTLSGSLSPLLSLCLF
jgi:hypothetical protein